MKKIVVACDSFKGSMSAAEVCSVIAKAIEDNQPDAEVVQIPVADGGEGTTDAYIRAMNGTKVFQKAKSPLLNETDAFYGIIGGDTAVIECAAASGITVEKEKDALHASTYGTGELIRDALDQGIRRFIVGLGGSATTDGGAGMLSALGVGFFDENGEAIPPGGAGLRLLRTVDPSGLDRRVKESEFTVLCDVINPLYGENGAAYVFSPQKGADKEQVAVLEEGLRHYAVVCASALGRDVSDFPGTGAAGGLGFAFLAFLGARLKKGIDAILDTVDFEKVTGEAALVITGEGRMDSQSLCGKVPFGVSARSKAERCIAVVGLLDKDTDMDAVRSLGIGEVYETNPLHLPFEVILPGCREALYDTAKEICI